jgi:hypothetical protein
VLVDVLARVENFDSPLGTHDGNFGARPRIVGITSKMFAGVIMLWGGVREKRIQ